MTLADLFPDGDYTHQLRFERGDAARFFAATTQHVGLIAQRRHWLNASPEIHAALLPAGVPLLEETTQLAGEWNGFVLPTDVESPWEACLALGEFWETDYLLLKREADGEIRLLGGCLCFPSSWRLTDKIGKPIEAIHSSVPGLNESIGGDIHKFLSGLKPGAAWLRYNWGLARSPALNQHPDRNLPQFDGAVTAAEVWLRVEHQALVVLPKLQGILFGIRIVNHSLAEVRSDADAAARLARALATMPEEMARYKRLADARGCIIEMLREKV